MTLKILHHKSWPSHLPHNLKVPTKTLYENLLVTVSHFPDRKALIYYGTEITYKSLFEQVNTIGNFIARFGGVKSDDRVILYMQNCPQFVVSYYAVLGINCVVVPVNPMLQLNELKYVVLDSSAKFIITSTDLLDKVCLLKSDNKNIEICILATAYSDSISNKFNVKPPEELKIKSVKITQKNLWYWKDAIKTDANGLKHERKSSDLSIIPYTSGTTGVPKGCEHTNKSVNAVIQAYAAWFPLPKGSNILASLPLFHVTGMQNSMNVPIFRGDTIVLMTRWDVDTALHFISKYKIKSWRSITTSIIDLISAFIPEKHDLSSLKFIGGGGAHMPSKNALKLNEITSLNYIEAYGMTETMAPTHINPPKNPKLGSIGIPIFNVDARIMNIDTGKQLGVGGVGELIVSGPQIFSGYSNDPKSTKDAFIKIGGKKFLKTGDLGYFDSNGYFYIIDRIKRMINYSGFKVWPAEVERILNNHPDIKEVCVVGVSDVRTGQRVKAVIVPNNNNYKLTFLTLKEWCETRMAKYKIPKIIEIRDRLPKNRIGKIMWRKVI